MMEGTHVFEGGNVAPVRAGATVSLVRGGGERGE